MNAAFLLVTTAWLAGADAPAAAPVAAPAPAATSACCGSTCGDCGTCCEEKPGLFARSVRPLQEGRLLRQPCCADPVLQACLLPQARLLPEAGLLPGPEAGLLPGPELLR